MSGRRRPGAPERFTLVSFHAHPDDEVLLTGGTMARAAAEGHRVVLVTATAGEAGLAAGDLTADLAGLRSSELQRSAAALGCARVELLGYPDSGSAGTPRPGTFAAIDPEEPARRLADLLAAEHADAVLVYDRAGGYGHPDHRQVHRVGLRAAEIAGTPVVLQATVSRALVRAAAGVLALLPGVPTTVSPGALRSAFSPAREITHRVDVRPYLAAKRAAMTAHRSQASADVGGRTLDIFLRLPSRLFALAFGHEWYVEHGRQPSRPRLDDIFASVRQP